MKSLVQNYSQGQPTITEVPAPALQPGGILVRNAVSLISAGTERLMVDMARKTLLGKARARPDLVRRVIDKVRRDGVLAAAETVRSRLDAPVPLGYSSAGTVIAVGSHVDSFRVGERVACAGAGYANHAETIFAPKHLAVRVPDTVSLDSAAFTTVGAIALQGLRLAEIELGETVAVIGFGLVGLLAAQLSRAAGCRVIGTDPDPGRCRLAEELGVETALTIASELTAACLEQTAGHGADKVIIAASTKSSQPLELAAELARSNGTVVAVGAVGMEVPRRPFYDKELMFRVSRSYGPGRYDADYEEKGRDYPIGHVRWTENRNMEAFVQQLAQSRIDVRPLISHRFDIADAESAYELLTGDGHEPHLGILLAYPERESSADETVRLDRRGETTTTSAAAAIAGSVTEPSTVTFGLLGAGQFATGVLLPALARLPQAEIAGLCTATGVKAEHAARKFGARFATTHEAEILTDPAINAVLIATRHHLHARQVIAALAADQHIFVEKPLCLTESELDDIASAYAQATTRRDVGPLVMVGYNRRFAPMSRRLATFLATVEEPLVMHYRVNAGYIPLDHWVQDPEQGGGRIIGEVCHFVDYLGFLAGAPPTQVSARVTPNAGRYRDDNLTATIEFANGSVGTITYVANGDAALAKERLEVFGGGASAVLDNFRRLELMRGGRRQVIRSRWRQDKGHTAQLEQFVHAAGKRQPAPIPWPEILATSRATFAIVQCLRDATRTTL